LVGGTRELVEKLGRNDPCPCGSARSFQALLPAQRLLLTASTATTIGVDRPTMKDKLMETNYLQEEVPGGVPIKMWTRGVGIEEQARRQLVNAARLPIVFRHIAAMPDVHLGIGATVGSVIPTLKAIIPAAVGVDIGCGMMACKTTLSAEDLPDNLAPLRSAIERAVPHGRTPGARDPGAWGQVPGSVDKAWAALEPDFAELCSDYPRLAKTNSRVHLGTLGTGNHFIEVCLDEAGSVWFMLHSGSRGVGNAIGTLFIELARQDAMRQVANLPDRDLAYFEEGSRYFGDYVRAVGWAQRFAAVNREVMMRRVIDAAKAVIHKKFESHIEAVNCHHNYVQIEHHFGQDVYITRKGAVSARAGQLGIIPGSMGARSFIVRGKGNADSFDSCSHGAGRAMSRGEARRRFTLADHRAATEGVECRKDKDVIDETPAAYKDIAAVMAAQRDLVDIVHTLKQVVCVKG
jgi:tRNA-splicing ligase RtcB